jgi:hypothetical protein
MKMRERMGFVVGLVVLGCVMQEVHGFGSGGVVRNAKAPKNFGGRSFTQLSESSETSEGSGTVAVGMPTELPDSLEDAAEIAARASWTFCTQGGTTCRVDFDTSIGDETYTTLKASTPFVQKYTTALSYAAIPQLMQQKQAQMQALATATVSLQQLLQENEPNDDEPNDDEQDEIKANKVQELKTLIANGGASESDIAAPYEGPKVRIYFPDEGSAALARRDWASQVPACVEYSSCGGIQLADTSKDVVVLIHCPRASESEFVEQIVESCFGSERQNTALLVMVNPLLVDMGVTGFGMAGRRLRERLLDNLTSIYYLRTLPWGALTHVWPRAFTVWQSDDDKADGYRMIANLDRLPSNPEVEDIYDIENGNMDENKDGFGLLNTIGDFVNGMMRL